ncbi:MAG: hypothetical protein H6835_13240 [Planctomycetes bacterium]|nr:hypothetical protein [Planctomycetota bacterium]
MPMLLAVSLSLLAAVTPQDPPATGGAAAGGQQPKLADRELKTLSDRLREYLAAETAYDLADNSKDREKTGKVRMKAKDKFEGEWDRAEKKVNLLASTADLRAIFFNCFERERPKHGLGSLQKGKIKDTDVEYSVYLPKSYKPTTPLPTVLLLPSATGAGSWGKAGNAFEDAWEGQALADSTIFAIPHLPEGLEMDPIPDFNREGAEAEEEKRNGTVLRTLGAVMNDYNVDRGRVFLDCGKGTCGYGLRLLTLFPDRFAGLVLRDPTAVDDLRLGSLLGIPVLMVKTGDNAAVVESLQKRLEEKDPGKVTVIDGKGSYPFKESAPEIGDWMANKQRNMTPLHVVIEPNHDRFNRSYWVDIEVADSLLTTSGDKRPRLEVKADPQTNRITVDAVGVERFEVVLNDDLVDLDKEFTIVVNGKAVQETRRRSFSEMKKRMEGRSDWDYLFPVRYMTTVPKE